MKNCCRWRTTVIIAAYSVHGIYSSLCLPLSLKLSLCLSPSPSLSNALVLDPYFHYSTILSHVRQPGRIRLAILSGTNVFATSIEPDVSMIVDRSALSTGGSPVSRTPSPIICLRPGSARSSLKTQPVVSLLLVFLRHLFSHPVEMFAR